MARKAAGSNTVGDVAGGFVRGFMDGARDVGQTGEAHTVKDTAQIVGDLAGALVPGVGELKAIQDVWEGIKRGDTTMLIGGLISLIPIVGVVGKAGAKGAKKIGAEVAKNGVKNTSLHLSEQIAKTARKALTNPKTKQKLTEAAEQAGQLALLRLVEKLTTMQQQGTAPDVSTRKHPDFIAAREAAFEGMGEKPGKDWQDLVASSESGKNQVVGRHEQGEKGFRFFVPGEGGANEDKPLRFYWWKDNKNGKEPTFGLEECPAGKAEVDRILDAYLNRDRSFRIKHAD